MTEKKPSEEAGKAKIVKAKHISLVWLIPFLALIVTGILLYKNTIEQGPKIEVTISSAEGIEEGKTLVKLRSVTVGRVESVRLDQNYTKAILSIQMVPNTENLLNEDSVFWLVKPRVETAGISGLDTLLSGSYLQIIKGNSQKYSTTFEALSEPPQLFDDKGLTLNFFSKATKRLSPGDLVSYRGFTVGRVLSSQLEVDSGTILYKVFIEEPYTKLLNANTRFWITSGLDFELSTEGLQVYTDSVESILRGGMSFDNLNNDQVSSPLDTNQQLELFADQNSAQADAMRSGLLYVILIDNDLRNIKRGSGVFFNSVKIGEVIDAPWFESYQELFFSKTTLPVLIGLNFSGDEREFVSDVLEQHAKDGTLCAAIASSSIISGDNRINLRFATTKNECQVTSYRNLIAVNATSSVSIDDRLNEISRSINDMDLAGVSNDVRKSLNAFTEAMNAFTRSNDEVGRLSLLAKMTAAFENFRVMLQSYDDNSEFYRNMDTTLKDVRQLLQELKPALVQLGQKPSSVIFGTQNKEVMPKAKGVTHENK